MLRCQRRCSWPDEAFARVRGPKMRRGGWAWAWRSGWRRAASQPFQASGEPWGPRLDAELAQLSPGKPSRASGSKTLGIPSKIALRDARARKGCSAAILLYNISFQSRLIGLHGELFRGARYSQLSEPCCGCVLQARALPRNSAAVPEWAAAGATARAADLETALDETALVETGAAVGTAKGDDETARRPKMPQQDGSRGSTTP